MTICNFAISAGHNVASPTNVESIIELPPHVLPGQTVPYLGPVKSRAGSGKARRDGNVMRQWYWDVMTLEDYNALTMAVWGDFTTAGLAATIITLDVTGRYARFNVYADAPYPDEDFTYASGGVHLRDVVMNYVVIASLGEFTAEFTEEFNI